MPLAVFTSPGPLLFQLGPFSLRWYGLLIAIAVLCGLALATRLGKQRGIDPALIADLLPLLVLAAVVGARIYYVSFEWRNYLGLYFWSRLNFFWLSFPFPKALMIWEGGIAIHGALIGGTLAVILYSRWRKIAFWNLLDVLLPAVALGQAIGRWGNFFNSEAFGLPTNNLPWKLTISPDVAANAGFPGQSTFHPTFLYEAIWNLGVLLLLLWLFRKGIDGQIRLPAGALSCVYLVAYSCGRLWIEGLRIDPLCLIGAPPYCEGGLRMAQLISLLLISLGSFGLYWLYGKRQPLPDPSGVKA